MGSTVSSDLIGAAQIPMELPLVKGLNDIIWPPQATLVDNDSYDFIVVGGGTAGSVVAARLAEDRNNSVFVAEAGDNPPILALIAGLFFLFPDSYVDYNYTSTQDNYAARGQNNFTQLTAGKMLGGSASLNHLIHTRGSNIDFDNWAKITNDSSWAFEKILKYFIKSESVVEDEIINKHEKFHGTKGPIGLSIQNQYDDVADYLKAFAEVGNPTVDDLNADINIGYTQPQLTIADKKRQTPAFSYLIPIKNYSNLHVSTKTRVTKIIFENNVAVAIEAVRNGKTYKIRAKKEIIICAGVFNTPQLLMLSGIGHEEHLKSFNINVLSNLPVGDNLVDQTAVHLAYGLQKHLSLIPFVDSEHLSLDKTTIPFPILVGSAALNKSQSYPDYQTFNLLFPPDVPILTVASHVVFGLRNEICDKWQKEVKKRSSMYTVLVNLQPKSRGTVRLRSADPFDDPVITTGYFTEDEDLKNMLNYVKDFIKVGETKFFKEIGAELVGLDLKECADKKKGSDDFWTCYILNHSGSPYHYTSTCPMGDVVDSTLKLRGMERVRVVDASVMPMVPRGAPNAAVIMLAEKAADMIKSDHSCWVYD